MNQQTIDIKIQSQGQPLVPSAEIQRLHLFVGKWKTEGETHASADAPAVKVTGVDTYEWLSGKFFLVHRANGHIGNEELNTIEFIGYDPSSQTYTCHCFVGAASPKENRHGNSDLSEQTGRPPPERYSVWRRDERRAREEIRPRLIPTIADLGREKGGR